MLRNLSLKLAYQGSDKLKDSSSFFVFLLECCFVR